MNKKPLTMAYLCLESAQEGNAIHTHVHEIIKGLEKRGFQVYLFKPGYGLEQVSLKKRFLEFWKLQVQLWFFHFFKKTFQVLY
ncbi:MAG: hypothetical protein D6785_09715, partial [Planctomycetota bacterium]